MLTYLHEQKRIGFEYYDGDSNTLMLASLAEKQLETNNKTWYHKFRSNHYEIKNSMEMVRYIVNNCSSNDVFCTNKLVTPVSGIPAFQTACRYANIGTVVYIFRMYTSRLNDREKFKFLNQKNSEGRNLFLFACSNFNADVPRYIDKLSPELKYQTDDNPVLVCCVILLI